MGINTTLLIDFSLTEKAATLIFISGGGSSISSAKQGKSSSISSAKQGKSGYIYNLMKNK